MTGGQLIALVVAALVGYVIARIWIKPLVDRPPPALMRTNVRGHEVPAVLGFPLAVGAIMGAAAVYFLDQLKPLPPETAEAVLAVMVVAGISALAGYADDRRGDEPARGFIGHLRAGLVGTVTGGLIKIFGIGLAGLLAGLITGSRDLPSRVRCSRGARRPTSSTFSTGLRDARPRPRTCFYFP